MTRGIGDTKYSDSSNYMNITRPLKRSHKNHIDVPSNKPRPIPDLEDQFYDSAKFVKTNSGLKPEQFEGEVPTEFPFPANGEFVEKPENSKWREITRGIGDTKYSDSSNYMNVPHPLKRTHKAKIDVPSNKPRPIPDLEDQFYDSANYMKSEDEEEPEKHHQSAEKKNGEHEDVPLSFKTKRVFGETPAEKDAWGKISSHITKYDDSKDYENVPDSLKSSSP